MSVVEEKKEEEVKNELTRALILRDPRHAEMALREAKEMGILTGTQTIRIEEIIEKMKWGTTGIGKDLVSVLSKL